MPRNRHTSAAIVEVGSRWREIEHPTRIVHVIQIDDTSVHVRSTKGRKIVAIPMDTFLERYRNA